MSLARQVKKALVRNVAPGSIEIITDHEAVEKDVGNSSLLVYGTCEGNLRLKKHVNDLPLSIEPDRVAADRVYPGTGHIVVSAMQNPQNHSNGVAVYTAQRIEDLHNICSLTISSTDFVVLKANSLLRSDNYCNKKGKWTFNCSLPEVLEDLDFFFDTIEDNHPNHLANISEREYEELRKRCRSELKNIAGNKGRISRSDFARILSETAAAFHDGHTSCRLTRDFGDVVDSETLLPSFRMDRLAGDMIIGETVPGLEHLKGNRLLKINGLDLKEFLSPILEKVSGKREEFRMLSFLKRQDIFWAVLQPVPGRSISISVTDDGEGHKIHRLDLIDAPSYRKAFKSIRSRPQTRSRK